MKIVLSKSGYTLQTCSDLIGLRFRSVAPSLTMTRLQCQTQMNRRSRMKVKKEKDHIWPTFGGKRGFISMLNEKKGKKRNSVKFWFNQARMTTLPVVCLGSALLHRLAHARSPVINIWRAFWNKHLQQPCRESSTVHIGRNSILCVSKQYRQVTTQFPYNTLMSHSVYTRTQSAPQHMLAPSARYPQSRPITSTTNVRWWLSAVLLDTRDKRGQTESKKKKNVKTAQQSRLRASTAIRDEIVDCFNDSVESSVEPQSHGHVAHIIVNRSNLCAVRRMSSCKMRKSKRHGESLVEWTSVFRLTIHDCRACALTRPTMLKYLNWSAAEASIWPNDWKAVIDIACYYSKTCLPSLPTFLPSLPHANLFQPVRQAVMAIRSSVCLLQSVSHLHQLQPVCGIAAMRFNDQVDHKGLTNISYTIM